MYGGHVKNVIAALLYKPTKEKTKIHPIMATFGTNTGVKKMVSNVKHL